jgi:hypothetical protein
VPEFVELPQPHGGTALINTDEIKRLGAVFFQSDGCFIEIQIGSTNTTVRVPFERIGGPGLQSTSSGEIRDAFVRWVGSVRPDLPLTYP